MTNLRSLLNSFVVTIGIRLETVNHMYIVTENDTETYKHWSELSYENQAPSKVTWETSNSSLQFRKLTLSRLRQVWTINILPTALITEH